MIPKLIVSTVRPLRRYHKKSLLIAVLRKTMAIEVRKLPLSRTNEPRGARGRPTLVSRRPALGQSYRVHYSLYDSPVTSRCRRVLQAQRAPPGVDELQL